MANDISTYLTELSGLKTDLANNLSAKGVDASTSEGFNTLVPKVLTISGEGGDSFGNITPAGSFGNILAVVTNNVFKTGTFSLSSPLSAPLVIKTNLDKLKGFLYYLEDYSKNPDGYTEYGDWGIIMFDEDGILDNALWSTNFGSGQGTGAFIRAKASVDGGNITVTPDFGGSSAYTPFRYKNEEYVWVAW